MDEKKRKKAEYDKAYRMANKEKHAAQVKAWNEANREKRAEYFKDRYKANSDKIKAYSKAWYRATKEKRAELKKTYYKNTRNKRLAYGKAWYEANREQKQTKNKNWKRANPKKLTAMSAKRRSQKLQATPKWMTEKDFAAIEEWYQIAKDLQWLSEEPLHVDHIIPLQGKDVCGLHIAANLQILPASMNLSKGNKIA